MGADLYRVENKGNKVPILGFERSQRAIDLGYFRDAYNSGSILNKYSLSWWVDIKKLQNEDGVITTENVIKFRKMLDDNRFELNIGYEDEENKKYFREGAELLKKYLDDIIKDNDSIEASL